MKCSYISIKSEVELPDGEVGEKLDTNTPLVLYYYNPNTSLSV